MERRDESREINSQIGQQGIDPWLNLKSTESEGRASIFASGPSAKEALLGLEALEGRTSQGLSPRLMEELIKRNLATEAPLNEVKAWQLSLVTGAAAQREVLKIERSLGEVEERIEQHRDRTGSFLYKLGGLLWRDDSETREDEKMGAKCIAEKNNLRERKLELSAQVRSGEEAKSKLEGVVKVEERYFQGTQQGKDLTTQLLARRSLLAGHTLDSVTEALRKVQNELERRLDRAEELESLFGQAGFDMKKQSNQLSIIALTGAYQNSDTTLKKVTDIDWALSNHGLNQDQRFYLASCLIGMRGDGAAIGKRFDKLCQALGSGKGSNKLTYEDLYVAANLAQKDGGTSKMLARFAELRSELATIGFKVKDGITTHLATRLATYDDGAFDRFKEIFSALKAKKYGKEEAATAALSMQRLGIPLDRTLALIEQTGAALQSAGMITSQKQELPFIASVASSPGAIDPLVQLMRDARGLIKNSTFKGSTEPQKALTLCLGAMSEFLLEKEIDDESDVHLAACGVDRTQMSRSTNSDIYRSSTTSGGDDGFWPYYWWASSDCSHSHHSTHDMGQHGHGSALCGSSSDHGSSGGHGGSHDSSGSHASCNSSSSHSSCSSGASSCSSSSSCGSSCGGGGCGGGGD